MRNRYNSIFITKVILLFSALSLMVCFIAESRDFVAPDSKDYILLADSLAAGQGYYHSGEPEIFRAPGYPFFLVPFRYFFPNTVLPVILVQILLGASSLFLLWRLAVTVFEDVRIAKIAVVFQLFSVTSLVFINKVLSETLFTCLLLFLLVLSEWLLKNLRKSQNADIGACCELSRKEYFSAFLCGLTAGSLAFIRAIFLPFFLLYLIYMLVRLLDIKHLSNGRCLRSSQMVVFMLLLIIPFSVIIGGWTVRNKKVANYAGFSSVGAINIYRYYACALMASNNHISFTEQQAVCDANLAKLSTQQERADFSLREGLAEIKKAPFKYLYLHLRSDMNTLLPAVGDLYRLFGIEIGGKGTLGVINSQGIAAGVKHYFSGNWGLFFLALPLVFILLGKYLAAGAGVVACFKPSFNLTLCFYLAVIIYFVAVPGAVSHPRFRVPVEPLLSLFAAAGIVFIVRLCIRRRIMAGQEE